MRKVLVAFFLAVSTACGSEHSVPQAPQATAAAGFVAPAAWAFPPGRAVAVYGSDGIVATTDHVASEIGVEVLRRGGNAVDAAVAIHFALAVVNPEAGNIGGGGFMVVRMADGGRPRSISARRRRWRRAATCTSTRRER
jgi:gamma-glutamyltranspeptidase